MGTGGNIKVTYQFNINQGRTEIRPKSETGKSVMKSGGGQPENGVCERQRELDSDSKESG